MLHLQFFIGWIVFGGPTQWIGFAKSSNAQLERFNSRFVTPGTEVVDAFTCNWAEDNNWWFPQVHLVS